MAQRSSSTSGHSDDIMPQLVDSEVNVGNTPHPTRFRCIISLLALVLAINRDGYPFYPMSRDDIHYEPMDEVEFGVNGTMKVVLNAVATLLARDGTEVAVAASTSLRKVLNKIEFVCMVQDSEEPAEEGEKNKATGEMEDQEEQVVIIPPGTSHLNLIQRLGDGNGWAEILEIPNNESLSNHGATLIDFLNSISTTQSFRWNQMAFYTMVRTWRKMYRRITHWSSYEFIQALQSSRILHIMSLLQGKKHRTKFSTSMRKDRSLFVLLKQYQRAGQLDLVLKFASALKFAPTQDNTAANKAPLSALMQALDDGSESHIAYQESCSEFHCLLITTLLGYEDALCELRKCYDEKADMKDKMTKMSRVWAFAQLLWRIAYSKMLQHHLEALSDDGEIKGPLRMLQRVDSVTSRTQAQGQEGDAGEVEELGAILRGENAISVFKNWIRVHVSHLEALRIVARYNANKDEEDNNIVFDLCLLGMKHCARKEPPGTLMQTIQTLGGFRLDDSELFSRIQRHSEPTQFSQVSQSDVTEVLECVIKKKIEEQRQKDKCHYIFKIWPNDEPRSFAPHPTVHCEAALASLHYHGDPGPGSKLVDIVWKSHFDWLAASKLCCPVCWQLLKLLRDEPISDDVTRLAEARAIALQVRGNHGTLYPVDLPSWLPSRYVTRMHDIFTEVLRQELLTMLANEYPKHRRTAGVSVKSLCDSSDWGFEPMGFGDSDSDQYSF